MAKKKFQNTQRFDGILGGLYSKNTVFSGKYSFEEQKFEGKNIHICELLTVNFEEQLK